MTIQVHDRRFRPFMSEAEIRQTVERLGRTISHDYATSPALMVCPILTGAYLFAADLVRCISLPTEVHFVRYASYSGLHSTGEVRCLLPFPPEVEGHDVLLVEDVVDTGLSMQVMLRELQALFFKPHSFRADYEVHYIGREIGNEFIIGYGMDYYELGRTLPAVYVIDE